MKSSGSLLILCSRKRIVCCSTSASEGNNFAAGTAAGFAVNAARLLLHAARSTARRIRTAILASLSVLISIGVLPKATGSKRPALVTSSPAPDCFIFRNLVPGIVVNHSAGSWLLRRSEEWKRITKRYVVAVYVVTVGDRLIRYEVEQIVDRIVAGATTVRKTGVTRRGDALAKTHAGIRNGKIQAQVVTMYDCDVCQNPDIRRIGSQRR